MSNKKETFSLQQKVLKLTLLGSFLLMLIKFTAYFLTNSDAILTDAFESIINVFAGIFALFSIVFASRPRDKTHPYGHGKIEFLSAGFEGALIVFAGLSMIIKAGYSLFYPPELTRIDLGLYLTVFSTAINFMMSFYLIHIGKKHHSLTLVADGKHLASDAYSSLGLIIGLIILYFTNLQIIDSLLAMFFAGMIIYTGIHLMKASFSGVMDEADEDLLNEVIEVLNKHRQNTWIDFHNLRIIKYGSQLHIDCHVTFPWYWNLQQGHSEIKSIETMIDESMGNRIEIFIHIDPCEEISCKICSLENCPVRKYPIQKKLTWNLDNVRTNHKHRFMQKEEE